MSFHGGRGRGTWIGLRGMEEDGGMTWKLGVSQQLWAPSVCGTEEEDRQGDTRQRVGTQVSLFVVDCPVPAVSRRGLFLTF